MVKFLRLFALLALVHPALTGGMLHVDVGGPTVVVTVCSEHGTYEMPLDFGDVPQDEGSFSCGDCVLAVASVSELPRLIEPVPTGRDRFGAVPPDDHRFIPYAWRAPPLRGPPSFV
ncbi:MAG: DUF2946 family protein [Pseudomonadota bacterium]